MILFGKNAKALERHNERLFRENTRLRELAIQERAAHNAEVNRLYNLVASVKDNGLRRVAELENLLELAEAQHNLTRIRDTLANEAVEAEQRADAEDRGEVEPTPGQRARRHVEGDEALP